MTSDKIADIIVIAIQMYHLYGTTLKSKYQYIIRKELNKITLRQKRIMIMSIIVVVGMIAGRLEVRGVMNLLMGGTLFGGNFL